MIVAKTIDECRRHRAAIGTLAFVPTMGALHAGHVSLVEHGRRHADRVALSIFVNPTQFGPKDDFHRYPRPLADDLERCRSAGVDLVFCPEVSEMYPADVPNATVDVPAIAVPLEGAHRPGHFTGVCQVVAKLFNIVQPHAACFGEKDFQQLAVLRAMTTALNFPIAIVPCPTLRERDGLAMSSRNRYLSRDERTRAAAISRSLFATAARVRAGERSATTLRLLLERDLSNGGDVSNVPVSIDYASIVDRTTLRDVAVIDARGAQALVAMRVGSTRLIDNVRLDL